jgi:uncharacterized protein YyaL (SSP411 family)
MTSDKAHGVNRLISEKSPYLLQHAYNPVDWHPWGEEAWNKAKNDGKPILLSIGYSTCHWCHVMAEESFEDEKLAEYINRHYVPIKVDREERPEVDSYYMAAVQGMTGQGGWPLTVFLTPGLEAFYGGTYYPPEPRYGMPSFRQVLEFVAKLWKDNRGDVDKEAERVAEALMEMRATAGGGELTARLLDEGFSAFAASFDPEHGGFRGAPKFPLPLSLEFMMRYHYRTGKELALRAVARTLDAMAAGGIYDHVGGGFHRYSTDRIWLVPHFEKMLYDNALLARVYDTAFLLTGDPGYGDTARETLGWMLSEMKSPEGAFYSAQDADTAEGEGVYYTWTPDELESVLGDREAEIFEHFYGVTKRGNFDDGRSILHRGDSPENAATALATTSEELKGGLARSRRALYEARSRRPRPATDTKILTSWNGLAVSALSCASKAFGEPSFEEAAEKAALCILSTNRKGGELMRRFAGGEAAIAATLEDYSLLGLGLLDLFGVTSEPRWLEESLRLCEEMTRRLEDEAGGGFFDGVGRIPARLMETHDGPMPSGNAAAVMLLLRLSAITRRGALRESADKAMRRFQPEMDREPTSHALMLAAADTALNGTREVVVSARTVKDAAPFIAKLRRFMPDTLSFALTSENQPLLSKLSPLAEGRSPGRDPVAYVCQNFSCRLPARTPEELDAQLRPSRS